MAMQIWAVDDEESLLMAIGELLRETAFEYRSFVDPREVIPALDERIPDLILVDLNMPRMTGTELIKALRNSSAADVPVMVLTALSSEGALLNAFKAGADDVVRKPFSFSELLARISWQLERAQQIRALRRKNSDLRILTELAKTMSQEDSLGNVLRVLVDSMRRALSVARCGVYLVDEESGELHRALPSDPSRAEGSPNLSLDYRNIEALAKGLASRRPVLLGQKETSELMAKMGGEAVRSETVSSAIYPMQLSGRLIGVIVLIATRDDFGQDDREKDLCSIASDLTAVAVRRSELFHSLRRDHFLIDERSRELAEAKDLLQGVIESSPDAIVVASIAGEILIFNRAAERILGWSRNEAIGMHVRNLYPAGGAERIMALLRQDKYGGEGRLLAQRHVLTDKEERELPVEISAALIHDQDGAEVATVGIFKDLRRDLHMEERLLAATEDLERTRRRVVVAELAGAAAHELNQPLTSLLGYTELMRRKVTEAEHLRILSKIDSDAKRVADIVGKIGRITDYRTKEYVGGARIMDLDSASKAIDEGEEH